jgi:hypothetical protein
MIEKRAVWCITANLVANDRCGSKARITAPQHDVRFVRDKQTLTKRVQCDAMCQKLTHAPQQNA